MKISKKYQILFEIIRKNAHKEVDTVIVTGGRGSGKTYIVSLISLIALVELGWNILYTRFTNVSITDSIKPEVDSKISILGYENYVTSTNTHIEYKENRIAFKGIKTGSNQQTANLKSLSNFNCFINDEAEELPDFETFEKVFLSIRSKDKRNLNILILNPQTIHHWIYKKFFKEKNVTAGFNGVKDNIAYIHTSYKDVDRQYLADNIVNYYEKLEFENPEKYNEIVLGGWVSDVKGRVFTNWNKISIQDFINIEVESYIGVDWGKSDPFGIIEVKFFDGSIYVNELNYKSENEIYQSFNQTQINLLRSQEGEGIVQWLFKQLNIQKDSYIICDSNYPDKILSLRKLGFYNAIQADKGQGSIFDGISLLQNIQIFYTETSKNLEYEYENYCHAKDRLGNLEDKFEDKNNHLIDPLRYVAKFLQKNGFIKKI